MLVAAQNGLKSIVQVLLDYGADVNAANKKGNTPLHFAHAYGFAKLAAFLMKNGADDSLQNVDGLTCYEGLSIN